MARALGNGRPMLLVDRREPLTGSTLASTALIQHDIDVPLFRLSRMIGAGPAAEVWRSSAAAVRSLKRIVREDRIACQWQDSRTLFLAGSKYGAHDLLNEDAVRRRAGLDCQLLDRPQLAGMFGIHRAGALITTPSASANPAQLTAGLLRRAHGRGAEIASPVEITAVHETRDKVILATSEGQLIAASQVVFCTGYEILKSLANRQHVIQTTWAIASRAGLELPAWLHRHVVWEGADPYLYFRATADGRVIAGGEDEAGTETVGSLTRQREKSRIIARKAGKLIGVELGEPEYTWAAAFGSTRTGLPLMGRVPGYGRVYSVMGFGGNGITFSQMGAELVKRQIRNRSRRIDSVFAF
jgi:glycine/D-amino acid oxidase-like deaminating enzyme